MDCKYLESSMVLDIDLLMLRWMEEYGETPETCTEHWTLAAYPVLADGSVALMFETEECTYGVEDGELIANVIGRRYKVWIIDPVNVKRLAQLRFTINSGRAATVFMRNGALYAALVPEGGSHYTALQVWPGSDDAHQIRIGHSVNSMACRSNGDIIVSYICDEEQDACSADGRDSRTAESGRRAGDSRKAAGHKEAVASFHADGIRKEIYLPHGLGIRELSLDGDEHVILLFNDRRTVGLWDEQHLLTFRPGPGRLVCVAVVGSSKTVYVVASDEEGHKALFRVQDDGWDEDDGKEADDGDQNTADRRMWGDDAYVESMQVVSGMRHGLGPASRLQPCVIRTGDGDIGEFDNCSVMKDRLVIEKERCLYFVTLEE